MRRSAYRSPTSGNESCGFALEREKGFPTMRMNVLSRYIDKYVDFDAIGERIDALQDRLSQLRDNLPDAPKVRAKLPSYRDLRKRLPFSPKGRDYTVPAALAAGGVAILGAIVLTAYFMSDANKRVPKRNEDMV